MANIIVVDDDKSLRESIQDCLELENHKVFVASNRWEAGVIAALLSRVDLLLTDYNLSASQTCEKLVELLAERVPKRKMVIMSGSHEKAEQVAQELGVGFIAKPFSITSLHDLL